MDKKLQLIRHLYGETDDRDSLRELLQDEDLNAEYQELSEAKFWLDHTSHERPDQAVLDTIFAAAGQPNTAATPTRQVRKDRTPVARQNKTRRRLFGPVSAVLTLVVVLGIGYQVLLSPKLVQTGPAAQSLSDTAMPAANEPVGFSQEVAAEEKADFAKRIDARKEESFAVDAEGVLAAEIMRAKLSEADTSLPEWNDDMDDILRFQRRIDMLLEQNQDLAWDEAAVPLESLRSGRPANPGLLQAGSRTTKPGNQ